MKQLFQKKPFAGWLILFSLLLGGAMLLNSIERSRYQPAALARLIEKDFHTRERAALRDYRSGAFYREDIAVTRDPSSPSFYILHVYKNRRSYYWNNNTTAVAFELLQQPGNAAQGRFIRSNNGLYYLRRWAAPSGDTATVAFTLVPVATDYSIENKYFRSGFVAGDMIPEGTAVTEDPAPGAIAIRNTEGRTAFYITFREHPLKSRIPGFWLCLLFAGAVLSLAAWLHKICLEIGQRTRPVYGWLILLAILSATFVVITRVGSLPFNLRNIELFTPQLLSSGDQIRSFGDLILYALADAWILAYLFLHVPFGPVRIFRFRFLNFLLALLLSYIAIGDIFNEQMHRMSLLVIDSKIPFEVVDFSNINIYTVLGLLIFAVMTFNFILLLCIHIKLCRTFPKNRYVKYILLVLISFLVILQQEGPVFSVYHIAVIVLALAGILLLDRFGFPMRPMAYFSVLAYSPRAYIWFALICSWITLEIFYFNYTKEKDLRKIFAQKLEQKQDIVAELAFTDEEPKIASDTALHNFLKNPTVVERGNVGKHLYYEYLSSSLKKYKTTFYFYNKSRMPVLNPDTADKLLLRITDSIRRSDPALSGKLLYLSTAPNGYIYRADIPVTEKGDTLGFIGLSLSLEQNPRKTIDPLYLKASYNPTDQLYFDKYNFAIYKKGKLVTESSNNGFPYLIREEQPVGSSLFREQLNQSVLYYRASEEEIICVSYKRRLLINAISLFSYVLATVVLISIGYLLIRHFIFNPLRGIVLWRRFNLTIRAKVNLTILITVFLSFAILGVITVSYLVSRYREKQQKALQSAILYVSRSVMKSVEDAAADMSPDEFAAYVQQPKYTYSLNELADDQNVDVNIFSAHGTLKATTLQDFNQKGYLSRLMNRRAFELLTEERRTEYTHIEKAGGLRYQSSYTPIRNKRGVLLGFVNVPYYTSQTELNDEIANILAVLINLYTFIFFLSGISAVLISNNVIRSFNLLINQFKNIRLRHNEPLHWPYRDEIGMLVNEYNAMIQKVERMATRLANSEREAAWREIAKQVAHEIKNPLTPMKLQIQYLQQAIAQGKADITGLTARVTAVLLEQIEHLSLIASEFSDFAKLPQAHPERLDAHEMLRSLAMLFHKQERVHITLHLPPEKIYVWIDKGYFIRILTNIVQNAIQAIPEEREGLVEIICHREDMYALILVKDNGTGISPEIKSKLFLPYFTTKTSGTGLGLSMTKNMIELSNGSVSLETEEGKGTTFFIRIPLAE